MKATELRIGNWIKANGLYEGKEMQVEEIGSKGSLVEFFRVILFKDAHAGEFIQHLEGIPLTEEWLKNFGFSRTICNKDSGYKQYGKGIRNFDFMFSIECNERPAFYLNSIRVKIDNVHQLQNLAFSLTGEELQLTNNHSLITK